MPFLQEYKKAVGEIRLREQAGTEKPGTASLMMEQHQQNINRICDAMHDEVKQTASLIDGICYDAEGHARQPELEELMDLMVAHHEVYMNTRARITVEAQEMNDLFIKYVGRPLYQDIGSVDFADRMVAELGDLTQHDLWAYQEASLGLRGPVDADYAFEMDIRKMSQKAIESVRNRMSVSGQQFLKDQMSGKTGGYKTGNADWGREAKDPDLRTIFKLEELYHRVVALKRSNQEQIVERMRQNIGTILNAMRNETVSRAVSFLEMADYTTGGNVLEDRIAGFLARQFSEKAKTDEIIAKAVLDLHEGAMHVLHTDLLEGRDPVEWAEDFVHDLRAYGQNIERMNELAKERGAAVIPPSGFPFFDRMAEGCKALFKQLAPGQTGVSKDLTLRSAVLNGAKTIRSHSIVVRTTKAMTGYRNLSVCILPVYDKQTQSMRNVPIKAFYDKESDSYIVGEAEYMRATAKSEPAVPVVKDLSEEPDISDKGSWSGFRHKGVLKEIFGYGPEMPKADRETIIRGVIENRKITEIDALLSEVTDEIVHRQQDGGYINDCGLGDAVQAITGVKEPKSFLAWYFGSQRYKGGIYQEDCDYYQNIAAQTSGNRINAELVFDRR